MSIEPYGSALLVQFFPVTAVLMYSSLNSWTTTEKLVRRMSEHTSHGSHKASARENGLYHGHTAELGIQHPRYVSIQQILPSPWEFQIDIHTTPTGSEPSTASSQKATKSPRLLVVSPQTTLTLNINWPLNQRDMSTANNPMVGLDKSIWMHSADWTSQDPDQLWRQGEGF